LPLLRAVHTMLGQPQLTQTGLSRAIQIEGEAGANHFLKIQFLSSKAALKGHLDCLRYAHEYGCPWDTETCQAAAVNGHLDCLRYVHKRWCPWDTETCQAAALNGHLDCLRYAHEHGCPCGTDTCRVAVQYGHLDCCSICILLVACGIRLPFNMQLKVVTQIACSMLMSMGVRMVLIPVELQPLMVT
jgi:hypothetical protein